MRVVRTAALWVCALIAAATSAHAQTLGQVTGVVTTTHGAALSGVAVALTGATQAQPLNVVTSATGAFEFPRVPAGTYTLTVRLSGFKDATRTRLQVRENRTATVNLTMDAASAVPDGRYDAGATALDTTIDRNLMLQVPTAREPWQIMKLAPGVTLSGVNVAGSASGQQLTPQAFGSSTDVQWHIDGGTITDVSSNSSPIYYNFDSLDAVQVVTGGGDVSVASQGVFINLITKSGTNTFTGSATTTFAGSALQSQNVSEEIFNQGGSLLGGGVSGTPLRRISTSSAEIGGPIHRDRIWFWGGTDYQSIGVTATNFFDTTRAGCNPPQRTFDQLAAIQACLADDKTSIQDVNAKLTSRLSPATTLQVLFQTDQKKRNNRPGAGSTLLPTDVASTQSQYSGAAFLANPLAQVTHTWNPTNRFGLQNQMTYVGNGFFLDSHDYGRCGSSTYARDQAGLDPTDPTCAWNIQALTNRTTGITTRAPGSASYQTSRPSWEVRTDDHYLAPHVLGGDHTLRFGAGWRDDPVLTYSHQGGGAVATVQCSGNIKSSSGRTCDDSSPFVVAGSPAALGLVPRQAVISRDGLVNYDWRTFNWYVQDAYTTHRLTVTGGTRWDWQTSTYLGGCVSANVILPVSLPRQCQDPIHPDVGLSAFAPRFSATYDVSGDGRTTVRSSFAVYRASKLTLANRFSNTGTVALTYGPNSSDGSCFGSCWTDANRDGVIQPKELTGVPTASSSAFTNGVLANTFPGIDGTLKPARTREGIVGVDRELGGGLRAAVDFVYRYNDLGSANYTDVGFGTDELAEVQALQTEVGLWQRQLFVDPSTGIAAPYYTLCQGCATLGGNTFVTTNLTHNTYKGVTTSLAKRLSKHWEGQVSYTWSDSRVFTPLGTFSTTSGQGNPTGVEFTNGFTNGTPPHDFKGFGYLELPHGFTAGVNLSVRSGDVRILTINGPGQVQGATYTTLTFQAAGTTRMPVISQLDLNVAKSLHVGRNTLTLTLDCFNVLNAGTALSYLSSNISTNVENNSQMPINMVSTMMPPRVFRIDARFAF